MGCIRSLIIVLAIHTKIVAPTCPIILMFFVIGVKFGIHLCKKAIQVHAIAVKDILIDLIGMVPTLGDCDIVSIRFLYL